MSVVLHFSQSVGICRFRSALISKLILMREYIANDLNLQKATQIDFSAQFWLNPFLNQIYRKTIRFSMCDAHCPEIGSRSICWESVLLVFPSRANSARLSVKRKNFAVANMRFSKSCRFGNRPSIITIFIRCFGAHNSLSSCDTVSFCL